MARRAALPLNRHQAAWRNATIGIALVWALALALDLAPDRGGHSADSSGGVVGEAGAADHVEGHAAPAVRGGGSTAPAATPVGPGSTTTTPSRAESASGPAPAPGVGLLAPRSEIDQRPPPLVGGAGTAAATAPRTPAQGALTSPDQAAPTPPAAAVELSADDDDEPDAAADPDDDEAETAAVDDDDGGADADGRGPGRDRGRGADDAEERGAKGKREHHD